MRNLVLWGTLVLLFLPFLVVCVPMVSFGKSYDEVIADAVSFYNIDASEYSVEFKEVVINSKGQEVQGRCTYIKEEGKIFYQLEIKESAFRPLVVETIFHEFAHIAQSKYNLDSGEYTHEQHADILAFSVMWKNGYRWDAFHLLPTHILGAKPANYCAPDALWEIATGTQSVAVQAVVAY